jgi:hypothetical protein
VLDMVREDPPRLDSREPVRSQESLELAWRHII